MDKQKQEFELKPCPFCGGREVMIFHRARTHYVMCLTCSAKSGDGETQFAAAAQWNTRTEPKNEGD